MAFLSASIDTSALDRLANGFRAAGAQAPVALARGINATGLKARTEMRRALAAQTGMRYAVMVRAIRSRNATPGNLRFEINSKGGNVRLKFFKPRETKAGVTAAPWNQRTLYAGTFMKGGRFPNRVPLSMGRGNVFARVGSGRTPLRVARSGLFIPDEMIRGASKAAFDKVTGTDLPNQVARALYAILSGVAPAGRV